MDDRESAPKIYVKADEARKLVEAVLLGNGAPADTAAHVAHCLIAADLRGVDTHGMHRIPSYMERIRRGVLDPRIEPTVKYASSLIFHVEGTIISDFWDRQVTPVVHHIDGKNGFGYLSAKVAMDAAIESAKVYGIGMASVTHSNHFGMSAWIVQQAIDANMMSLVFTNSSPTMTVWGGASKRLGGVSMKSIPVGAP